MFAEHCIQPYHTQQQQLLLIIGRAGGAGKSQIFHAVKEFFNHLQHSSYLKITAPTGLAADNIGGTTIHSEASLCIGCKVMHTADKKEQALHANIEEQFKDILT